VINAAPVAPCFTDNRSLTELPLVLQTTEAWQRVKQSELFEHSTDEPTVMQLPSIHLIDFYSHGNK